MQGKQNKASILQVNKQKNVKRNRTRDEEAAKHIYNVKIHC